MAICGVNDEMVEGARMFKEGLIEHGILKRAKEKNQTIDATLEHEFQELDLMLNTVNRIDDPNIKELILGLTHEAKATYNLIQKHGIQNYKTTVNEIVSMYKAMDVQFYGPLEGKLENMDKFMDWISQYAKNTKL
ncbi:MAG: hypothetical protein WC758_04740 [Candidatus Woesearchaeota archaeon]|jgi:hypothetical protein